MRLFPAARALSALLNSALQMFQNEGIQVASNCREVVWSLPSDKKRQFERLRDLGLPVPESVVVKHTSEIDLCGQVPLPCIVEPTTGTGGSSMTFLASTHEHIVLYVQFLLSNGKTALVQDVCPKDEGEFTVGVIFTARHRRGRFHCDASFISRQTFDRSENRNRLDLKWLQSQGLIDDFPQVQGEMLKK